MKYKQWRFGEVGALGLGFDPDELAQVAFNFDVCFKHREGTIEIRLLGGSFSLFWFPPL